MEGPSVSATNKANITTLGACVTAKLKSTTEEKLEFYGSNLVNKHRVSQNSRGYYGGAAHLIISVFTQMHRSSFNLEFEKSQSDTGLLICGRKKAKLVVASKTALLLFSSNSKGILTICKWSKHLGVLNFINSSITMNKIAEELITLISWVS